MFCPIFAWLNSGLIIAEFQANLGWHQLKVTLKLCWAKIVQGTGLNINGLYIQCNLDLVTLLVFPKTVIKLHNVAELNDFCSKLKDGLSKIVTKSQVITKFNVTNSRLHCIMYEVSNLAIFFRRFVQTLGSGWCRFA